MGFKEPREAEFGIRHHGHEELLNSEMDMESLVRWAGIAERGCGLSRGRAWGHSPPSGTWLLDRTMSSLSRHTLPPSAPQAPFSHHAPDTVQRESVGLQGQTPFLHNTDSRHTGIAPSLSIRQWTEYIEALSLPATCVWRSGFLGGHSEGSLSLKGRA